MGRLLKIFVVALTVLSVSHVWADEATRAVQEELRRRYLFYGEIDGRESPELAAALKRYQERKGFKQTDAADLETIQSMGVNSAPVSDLPDVPVLRSDRAVPEADRGAPDAIALVSNSARPKATCARFSGAISMRRGARV